MPDLFFYTLFFIFFFFFELLYFRLASAYHIIDQPNERSSHTRLTIRGGGIIFPFAVICWVVLNHFQYPLFLSGLLLISGISFLDDIKDLPGHIRFLFHFLAVLLMILQLSFLIAWYWYIPIFITLIGFINAYNFMDGINGITGGYSLVTIITLLYINTYVTAFMSSEFLILIMLVLLIFNFFNFRVKARCFAGDIGSVSIAFIICFLIITLIIKSNHFLYIGLVLLYGLDTVTTIIFRFIRKENIFEAHRSHFYQFLANEKKWPHLAISSLYCIVQLTINFLIINYSNSSDGFQTITQTIILVLIFGLFFISLRLFLEGKTRLIGTRVL